MWRYLFSFEGRINRAKAWLLIGLLLIFDWLLAGFSRLVMWIGEMLDTNTALTITDDIVMVLVYVVGAAANIVLISVAVRRMHDANRSGWLLLAYPIAGVICALPDDARLLRWIVGTAMLLLFLFEMFVLPGTSGSNRYGPDPLAN